MTPHGRGRFYASTEYRESDNKAVDRCTLKAVALTDEKDPSHLDTLAEAYFLSGEQGKAVETIRKAIALEPNNKHYQELLDRFEEGR